MKHKNSQPHSQIHVRDVSPKVMMGIKLWCVKNDLSIREFVRQAVAEKLARVTRREASSDQK